jgi:fructosamine-3-kinase
MKIQPKDRPEVKAECLRLLATLQLNPARMQIISGFVDTYLRLNAQEEQVFQAEIGKMGLLEEEQVMRIVTSWMEKGAADVVLRQLNRRLGNLDSRLEERIRGLSYEQLENLGEALLDFSSEADLVSWLNGSST